MAYPYLFEDWIVSCLRFVLIGILGAACSSVAGDDDTKAHERMLFMTTAAKSFEISADNSAKLFEWRSDPLMRWNNPVSSSPDGGLFLWTDAGRPAVAIKFYQKADGTWLHNLQSLATRPFTAHREGRLVWNPRTPGVTFQRISDAPPPAQTSIQRKLQLRRLSSQFQLEEQYQEEKSWQLRQLTTPLLHYQAAQEGVLDGGLFAFVVGTTPEAVLLIEALAQPADGPVWNYAFAPLTGYAITAHHKGVEVWSAERRRLRRPINEPYTSDYYAVQPQSRSTRVK